MRTQYDLEMMKELGFCNGIENYSRILDDRPAGLAPHTLIDYFPSDFIVFIDESHQTVPQIGGMYEGDRSRKLTLVDHGFRLPSAIDNRPLKFDEFLERVNQVVMVSATPGEFERTPRPDRRADRPPDRNRRPRDRTDLHTARPRRRSSPAAATDGCSRRALTGVRRRGVLPVAGEDVRLVGSCGRGRPRRRPTEVGTPLEGPRRLHGSPEGHVLGRLGHRDLDVEHRGGDVLHGR